MSPRPGSPRRQAAKISGPAWPWSPWKWAASRSGTAPSSRLASTGALPPDQNERLVAAITRPAGAPPAPPALISADWNTECADRIPAAGKWPPR
jgi:hypothetical protein